MGTARIGIAHMQHAWTQTPCTCVRARLDRYGPPWGGDCPTGCPDALSAGFVALDDLDTRYWTYTMEWKTGPDGHLSW
jgi:hypothetical protein